MNFLSRKNKLNIVFKFTIFFVLFYVSFLANIGGIVFPFSIGIFFALVWCNQNIVGLGLSFLLASYLCNFSPYLLLGNTIMCTLFAFIYFIHYKIKKPLRYIHLFVYAFIYNLPMVFIQTYYLNYNLYASIAEFVLELLFMLACIKIFEAFCVRGICGRFTVLEIICAFLFATAIATGLSQIVFFEISLIKFVGVLVLLLLSYTTNFTTILLVSLSFGMGSLLATNSPEFLSLFVIYGLSLCVFKTKYKYISIISIIAVDCAVSLYLMYPENLSVFSVIPVIVASLIYILIPCKVLDKIGTDFTSTLSCMTQQSVINRNREMLKFRLNELSDVFSEMNRVYRGMISSGINQNNAKKMALNELRLKNCKNCVAFNKCHNFQALDTNNSLKNIIEIGFNKGRITLLDIPSNFAGKCERLNGILSTTNDLVDQYKNYAGLVNNIDASRVLLAEQFLGVSEIMHDLSQEVAYGVKFEQGKEKKILDELTYNNIICSDALVFDDADNTKSVTICVRSSDSKRGGIVKVISKICNQKMEVISESASSRAGWDLLTLKTAPKYDVVFAVSTKTKTGSYKSGDCYSIIKIKGGKYLFALCDGMGSGLLAEKTSSTAIGLIENFFKAGFDREIILSSVNKLLSIGKDDVFSALDLCVVDTNSGLADFIKMGAPESFIKHKETIEVVNLSSLPLGIVQNAESKISQNYLSSGDKIIIMTDGITDSFPSLEYLSDFINNITATTPKAVADEIINKALELSNNVAKDDMSVIVVKVFEK